MSASRRSLRQRTLRRIMRPRSPLRQRRLLLESLEPRLVLASAWQNPFIERDMSGDAIVSPVDGLLGINELNEPQIIESAGKLPHRANYPDAPYFDVNGDDFLSPIDILRIINALEQDDVGPTITAQLASDTSPNGQTNDEGITSNATVTGQLWDLTGITSFTARVDSGPAFGVTLSKTGTFNIDPGFASDGTDDGEHVLNLFARDAKSLFSHVSVPFTLDTVGPTLDDFNLAEGSDSAPVGDGQTSIQYVSLVGTAAPQEQVQLLSEDLSAGADATGVFKFFGVPLKLGANALSVTATDAAGNETTRSKTISRLPPEGSLLLAEDDNFVVETSSLVQLGLTDGARTLSFDLLADFDTSYQAAAVEDTLLVYLVDPNDQSQTLLDRGEPGTALFSLSGDQADFVPGLVQGKRILTGM